MSTTEPLDDVHGHPVMRLKNSSPILLGLLALNTLLILLHVLTLRSWPAPFIDEAWFIARARGFAEYGYPFGALDAGVFDKLPNYQYFFPYLSTALQAIPFLFSDEPNLYATRAISLFFGLSVAFCGFIIGKWASGLITGLLSSALILSATFFNLSGHMARIDSQAAAIGFIGFTLVLTNQRRKWIRFLCGGFLAGIAVELHAHAAVITLPALAAALTFGPSIRLRLLSLLPTLVGCGLSVALYAALHIIPDPSSFRAFQAIAFAPTHTPPLLTLDFTIMVTGLVHAMRSFFNDSTLGPLIVTFIYLGGIALMHGRARTIGVLAGLATLSCGLLIRHKMSFYEIYFHPLTLVFLAALAIYLFRDLHTWRPPRRALGRLLQACVLAMCVKTIAGATFLTAVATRQEPALHVLPGLSGVVAPEDTILGPQTFWLSVPDNRYYSPEHLIYYTRWRPGSTVSDALLYLRPTLIIEDDSLRHWLQARDNGCPYICFPDDGLRNLLASSSVVAEIPNETLGNIRVYRPRWEP
jgi:4-amino-4-deoxy-L-arabinose transferase-like glycosyltransferase